MNNHLSYHVVVFQSSLEENFLITKDPNKEKKEKKMKVLYYINKNKVGEAFGYPFIFYQLIS